MIRTLKASLASERTGMSVPRTAQKSIPIRRIYPDGMWHVGKDKYSRTWRLSDINYSVASPEDQENMFRTYSSVLNSLPTDAVTKITIINHRLNTAAFQDGLMISLCGDALDHYRSEYNTMLLRQASAGNGIVQDKYITISASRKNADDAKTFFSRISNDLVKNFARLESSAQALDNVERLRILHDFFRIGEENNFTCDLPALMKHGQDFKDFICPDSLQFKSDHFLMGDGKVGRALFLKNLASFVKDDMIMKLTDLSRNLVLSIDILPVPTDEAVKEIQSRILSVETDITRWQQRQNDNNNFSATIPYELAQMREETKEFLSDLTSRDERMMFVLVTLVHVADSLKELDADTEALQATGREYFCDFSILKWQQEDALNTALPYGLRPIEAVRTLVTAGTAAFMPFASQEIRDANGICYGTNAVSGNLIICDRKRLLNGNSFLLGVSGAGKSFKAKEEITAIALSTNDDIIVVDPEREYSSLIQALGGETIQISANSPHHINPLALGSAYGLNEDPIAMKSEFMMSICEQQIGVGQVGAYQKSIIDRCTSNVYEEFFKNGRKGAPPTLLDWRADMLKQPEAQAQELALAAELFTEGSLNTFAHQTNVDMNNRIMHYDLFDMGEQLKPIGLNVMLESIQNRVAENYMRGHYTWVFIDEIYLYFKFPYSAQYLYKCWKRFRKYYALIEGITQNVEECLKSETARLMLANSEFVVMLNQAATDRAELAKLLGISDSQLNFITNVEAGCGLLRVGGALVPFVDRFPKDTDLYKLMTTKPGER